MWPFGRLSQGEPVVESDSADNQLQTQDQDENRQVHLRNVWSRIESVCKELWGENSKGALKLRIAVEEFRGEVERAEEIIYTWRKALHQEKRKNRKLESEARTLFMGRMQHLHGQLELAQESEKTMQVALERERGKIGELMEQIEKKEIENASFKEQFLKSGSDRNHVRSEKMQKFIKELQEKEDRLEDSWVQRHHALEAEYTQRKAELQKGYDGALVTMKKRAAELEKQSMQMSAELEASYETARRDLEERENQARERTEELRCREADLKTKEAELNDAFAAKQRKLDAVKRRMDEELHEILKDYKAGLGTENPKEGP